MHIGTLAAVVFYFREQLAAMARAWIASATRRQAQPRRAPGVGGVAGHDPGGVVGLFFNDYIEAHFRSPLLVATTLASFWHPLMDCGPVRAQATR